MALAVLGGLVIYGVSILADQDEGRPIAPFLRGAGSLAMVFGGFLLIVTSADNFWTDDRLIRLLCAATTKHRIP